MVGALQGIAAEGYEVVLVGEAKPWLAAVVSHALRSVGVVGARGVVKEANLLFCSSPADKLRIAKALGKVSAIWLGEQSLCLSRDCVALVRESDRVG